MRRVLKGLAASAVGVCLLSGCMTANYYTEQGTPITEDTIQLFNTNPKNPVIPYSRGKATFDAFYGNGQRMKEGGYGVPSEELGAAADYWLHDEQFPPLDISVNYTQKMNTGTDILLAVPNLLLTIFSAGLIPWMIPSRFESTIEMRAGDELVYQDSSAYRGRVFYAAYPIGTIRQKDTLQQAQWYAALFSHEEKLTGDIYNEQPLYDSLKATSDVKKLTAALDNPDLKFYRPLVSTHLAEVLAGRKRNERLKAYAVIVEKHPEFADDIQGNERLLFVGPADLRVMDVLKETYRKRSAPAMAASIKAAGQPYGLFTPEESSWLTREGLPADVVAAMIEVSEPKAAPGAGPAGLMAAAAPGGQAGAQPVAGNTLEATATECSKAYAAKKVCETLPGDPFGLLMRGCMAQVKKKFGGSGCSIF